MKNHIAKLFIGGFLLLIYISIATFGLYQLGHSAEMSKGECPYMQNSYALCNNSFGYINGWQQFSNVVINPIFILAILVVSSYLYIIKKLPINFYKRRLFVSNKKTYLYFHKIIRWLSLFENSPQF